MAGVTKTKSGKRKAKAEPPSPVTNLLPRARFATIRRRAVKALIILALFPVFLTLLYAIPGIRPVSTIMLGRMLIGQTVDRQWVGIEDIADVLPQSVIMSEDGQFCFHSGVDWRELNGVIDDALEGEKTRGASTLPMQTVKNLYFWPQRSFIRKIIEIPYALIADLVWSKRRMMEIYLNIAEWDEGVFGIEAASQHHFKKPASKLSARQAALLTVALPNPKGRNPAKPTQSLSRLAKLVEKRASQSGAYVKCLK